MNQPIENKGGEDMKKLLITGFEPFGGESINPSWEAVSRLPERIKEYPDPVDTLLYVYEITRKEWETKE